VDGFFRVLADAVVPVHYGFLLDLISGGFLAWRWPRTIGLHLLAAVWATLIVTTGMPCPLTALQDELREAGGEGPLHGGGFISRYVRGTFYPTDQRTVAQALVALVVLASWGGLIARHRPSRGAPALAGGPASSWRHP
jgi:hypothetical protein